VSSLNNISLLLAFSAGLLSFLSPCVLPLVPAYITYLTGSTIAELNDSKVKLKTLYNSLGFVLGFSIIFIIMGASISTLGQVLIKHQALFRKIGGLLIIILGIHMTGIIKINFLFYEKRAFPLHKINKNIGPIFIGMAFAAGWTPCIGPILSSILIYAGSMETIGKGILLLVFYSLGLAIPFIATAAAISSFSTFFKRFSKYMSLVSIISGVLLIVMGIIIFINKMGILSRYFNFINF
jgi:cytochrome c-type biogenesis protein